MILCSNRGLLQNNPVETWCGVCRWCVLGPGSVIAEVGWCAHGASLHFIIKIKRKKEQGRKGGFKKKREGTNYHLGGQMRGICNWLSNAIKEPLEIRELKSKVRPDSMEVCISSACSLCLCRHRVGGELDLTRAVGLANYVQGIENIIHPPCW